MMRLIPSALSVMLGALLSLMLHATPSKSARTDSAPSRTQRLCGWYDNPSPQNAYLIDRTGEWVLSEMAGHQAEGNWSPDFGKSQWFLSGSGSYGYGCACMNVIAEKANMKITKVLSSRARPIDACYFDKTLPKRKRLPLSPLDR